MENSTNFYIDGEWVAPENLQLLDVINPATTQVAGQIALGSAADVDKAVAAARRAFLSFSNSTREERLSLLHRIVELCDERKEALAAAITLEMGSPISFSMAVQTTNAFANFKELIPVLETYEFEQPSGSSMVRREAIGVCGLISPWNWPLNQLCAKVAAALAAGCTVVVKPSEIAPLSAILLTEVMHDAGVPKGVFNLVNGDGPTVGEAISRHPDIDMVSFTGSTRAGVLVAQAAAPTVKRVSQELGGKSPNLFLSDADIDRAVPNGVDRCFQNTGQSCQSPTRMIVDRKRREEVIALARKTAEKVIIGDPLDPATTMGPQASEMQFEKVQALIQKGIDEGATLVCGGVGRPEGVTEGYYTQPTIFADVTSDMTIAREEIFGPVLSILFYDSEEEAITMANDTLYGLSAWVQSSDIDRAREVSKQIRAGRVYLNDAAGDFSLPFGGYKQSGNGREKGVFGLEEYLEVKAVFGYGAA